MAAAGIKAAINNSSAAAQPKSATASPRDAKKNLPAKSDAPLKEKLTQQSETQNTPPRQTDQVAAATKADTAPHVDEKPAANATQPLAPPPKPGQANTSETPDYFSAGHGSHFSLEPNPFEQSFGNPSSAETPGRFTGLPSVASLTSPAPLGPGGTPGWQLGNSLRSGPLSPAMLPGPTNQPGYFDEQFRQSFPTPNESSLRTGLTPGGGGSMFPAPSPNSQAIFNSIQSGGVATPGTIEFQRTAMNAAARSKSDAHTHQPSQAAVKQEYQPAQQAQMAHSDPFTHPSDRDAVNSLYLLAQTGNRGTNQFAVPSQPQGNVPAQQQNRNQASDTSPTAGRGSKQSIGSMDSSNGGMSDNNDYDVSDGGANKSASKAKSKKASNGKGQNANAANNRRKAEEPISKAPANKRAKANIAAMDDLDAMDSDDDAKLDDDIHPSGRKMTDEEKRKNFLERNRVAALKCRQRKKQWLANLQAKVEIFTSENDALSQANQRLQEEVVNLKTLLLAHKDCAVSHQQGLGGAMMQQVLGPDFNGANAGPYGMGMPQNGGGHMLQIPPAQGMQRR